MTFTSCEALSSNKYALITDTIQINLMEILTGEVIFYRKNWTSDTVQALFSFSWTVKTLFHFLVDEKEIMEWGPPAILRCSKFMQTRTTPGHYQLDVLQKQEQ